MIVISGSSPVTSLIRIGKLSLLESMYGIVVIPAAVHRELSRSHAQLPPFLQVRHIADTAMIHRLEVELDLGEAEAIVLAKESNADLLLIDEKLGRAVAKREGVNITGLVGILVEAKRRQHLTSVRECVSSLEAQAGFRLSDKLKAQVFAIAVE